MHIRVSTYLVGKVIKITDLIIKEWNNSLVRKTSVNTLVVPKTIYVQNSLKGDSFITFPSLRNTQRSVTNF